MQARPWIERIHAYEAGTPAKSASGSLASNESPLGTSIRVVDALRAAARNVHRYPDPLADKVRTDVAAMHSVDPEEVILGNGSDELIYLLAWAYLADGGHMVCADPAYRISEISAHVVNARLTRVPLSDWKHDLDAMADISADIAYIVNPHNPTGTTRTRAEIEQFVANSQARLVVVDEAYVDFADDPDGLTALPLLRSGRVAILRTLSKAYGLAGLRVGYLLCQRSLVATLRKIRAPFSVNAMGQAAAVAALADRTHWTTVTDYVRSSRGQLAALFEAAGYKTVPTQANFVLVETPNERAVTDGLARAGISVRSGSSLGVPGTVRVTVPSREGFHLLTRALEQIVGSAP